MSGHSKWSKIKHQKAAGDAKKGQVFSKMAKLIALAAKKGGDPDTNASLRDAINQAKSVNMPSDKIEKAIKKGTGKLQAGSLEEVRYEFFGPGGVAIIIEGITDNKNRTSAEIKHILSQNNASLAEPGSVLWAFEKTRDGKWQPKHTQEIPGEEKEKLKKLIDEIEEHDDVQKTYTNAL
jgi:YebC/PmpR family DNA-binding regulatory protein